MALGQRGWSAAVLDEQGVELLDERRVGPGLAERGLELGTSRHQRLGNEAATELAEAAGRVGIAHQ